MGGTSALECRGEVEGVGVQIGTQWAVDSEPDMALTFHVNFPSAKVRSSQRSFIVKTTKTRTENTSDLRFCRDRLGLRVVGEEL